MCACKRLHYTTVEPYDFHHSDFKNPPSSQEVHDWAVAEIQDQLRETTTERSVQRLLKKMNDQVNFVVAGIGLVHPVGPDAAYPDQVERLSMTGLLTPLVIDRAILEFQKAIGDFCYSFFRADGKTEDRWKFIVTAGDGSEHTGSSYYRHLCTPDPTKPQPIVMVIAGARKWMPLTVALKHKLCNALVTDTYTANKLLKN
jgi:DNA-binding transcriptional regulator LsrR (DeoR family)